MEADGGWRGLAGQPRPYPPIRFSNSGASALRPSHVNFVRNNRQSLQDEPRLGNNDLILRATLRASISFPSILHLYRMSFWFLLGDSFESDGLYTH